METAVTLVVTCLPCVGVVDLWYRETPSSASPALAVLWHANSVAGRREIG
jgi:hypothetical protein